MCGAGRPVARGIDLGQAEVEDLTWPRALTKMLAGLMSRCTMPLACADSSASAIWIAASTSSPVVEPLPRQPLRERLALEQLHDDEVLAARAARSRRPCRCSDD